MGLLDKLFDKGAKALGDAVSDKLNDMINSDSDAGDALRSMKSAMDFGLNSYAGTDASEKYNQEGRSFEEKLSRILQNVGDYELRRNISPDVLEQELGREIYKRGGCYADPEAVSYGIYRGGTRVLMIRLWYDYNMYNRMANRQIKRVCDENGIAMLDFFDYLPNEEDYMDERIRQAMVL